MNTRLSCAPHVFCCPLSRRVRVSCGNRFDNRVVLGNGGNTTPWEFERATTESTDGVLDLKKEALQIRIASAMTEDPMKIKVQTLC